MGIFELFGKKIAPVAGQSFDVQYELHPLKLPANKADYLELEINLRNVTDTELLTSVVLAIPKQIGFEGSALSHEKEIRLGLLKPGELKHLKVNVYATQRTPKAIYPLMLYVISHYRDYGYVLNELKKRVDIRVE